MHGKFNFGNIANFVAQFVEAKLGEAKAAGEQRQRQQAKPVRRCATRREEPHHPSSPPRPEPPSSSLSRAPAHTRAQTRTRAGTHAHTHRRRAPCERDGARAHKDPQPMGSPVRAARALPPGDDTRQWCLA